MDEQELARRCSLADTLAEDELYRRYAARLLTVCRRYTGNKEDAEDLMQDALIKALDKISTFRYSGKGSLYAWISRIAINMALNDLRRKRIKLVPMDMPVRDVIPDPTDEEMTRIPEEAVLEMISRLPVKRRVVFNLYCMEGYSHKEISEMLGISEKGTTSSLTKARMQLKKEIKQYLKESDI